MAPKIDKRKEHLLKEMEMLFKLLADELLLMLKTKDASQESAKHRHSKKIFLQGQHKELKEITDKILEYIATHKRKMTDTGNFIKTLLSEHENMISYYRENSSRITGGSQKDSSHFINSILEKHEKMAWALRAQLK